MMRLPVDKDFLEAAGLQVVVQEHLGFIRPLR